MHSVYVEDVGLHSPLTAELQFVDCVISARFSLVEGKTGGTCVGNPTQPRERTSRKCKNTTNMRAAPTPTCLHRGQKVCRRMRTSSRQGGSHTPPPRAQVCYHVLPRRQPPGPRHQPRREETNGLRPGSGCHGGLTVLPCVAMRGNSDNCSYSTTSLFVALVRTYTLMHSVVCRIPTYTRCHASLCMHSPSLLFTGPRERCVLVFASVVR